MAHPELEIISNAVESGNFVDLKKLGVTKDLFTISGAKEVFSWLWDEFHDPAQKGEVPTEGRLRRRFPDFDYSPSRNSIRALVSDIKKDNAQRKLTALVEEMGDELMDDSDATLILESFLPKMRELNVEAASQDGIRLSDAAEVIRQDYFTKKKAGGVTGIPYPWELMNIPTGGMQDEQFIVIYGRPGNMKTWIACVMAAWAWQANRRVMFFSKEISRKDILKRISSVLAGVDYAKLRAGNLPVGEEENFFDLLDAIDDIEEAESSGSHRRSLYCISDKGKRASSTVDDLIAQAEIFQPDLIVVDGFYLMRDGRSGTRTADWKQIAHISQDLKGMAQYIECPVIGTTQANRANAKQPSGDLDDLSFSDAIGMDADLVLRMFRGPNPTGRGAAIMIVPSKVREAVIRPFVVNAVPGTDFSVLHRTVNIKTYLESKTKMEQEENQQMSGATKSRPTPNSTNRKKNDPFRD
jgi:replicative DNA helicase